MKSMGKWLKASIGVVLLIPVISWYADHFIDQVYASRNGSGTYAIPNTLTPGTTISSADLNENFVDLGSEITGSLPRDGQAAMSGQFKAAAGTLLAPSISFSADTGTGFYNSADGSVQIVSNGVAIATISATGIAVTGDLDTTGDVNGGTGGSDSEVFPGAISCGITSSTPTGWLVARGGTIGDTTSGGTLLASTTDAVDLFTILWNATTNTELVIQNSAGTGTTRGASAAADFAAHKRMPVPDLGGRVIAGSEASASRLTSTYGPAGNTLATTGGSQSHTMTLAEMVAHTHGAGTLDVTNGSDVVTGGAAESGMSVGGSQNVRKNTSNKTLAVSGSTASVGSTTAFTMVQPTFIANCYIKD